MLTKKFLSIYGFVGIALMAVLLLLIWFKLVPQEYHTPLFVFAMLIWVSRLVLRYFLYRKERKNA